MAELQEIEQENSDNTPQSQALTAGAALEAARLEKGLTQQDVSNSLRYSVKQIDALEKNAFELLPDAMITRGFIRSYARLLEIDAEPLLASYRQSTASESDKAISVQSSMRPVQLTKESQPWLKYILASILVLLFLLAWLFYVDYMPKPENVEHAKLPEKIEQVAPSDAAEVQTLPEIALPAAQRLAQEGVDIPAVPAATDEAAVNAATPAGTAVSDVKAVDMKQPDSKQPDTKQVSVLTQPDPKTPVSVTQSALAQPPAAQSTVPTPSAKPAEKTLAMAFTAKTWVSIQDKSGKVIHEKMSQNGDQDTITAVPPLYVVIGNASGTRLKVNGQDVDLTTNTKNNVARMTLE